MIIGENFFEKKFSPNPFQKTLYYKRDKVCADLKYHNVCTAYKITKSNALHTLCPHIRPKVFGKGAGNPFFKKGFPRKNQIGVNYESDT